MPLEQIDENIWLAEGEIVSFHGFPYPTRAIIIRLPDGALWVCDSWNDRVVVLRNY
mgnify:CR=1 FL=1